MANWASVPQRESTRKLYESHWSLYHKWASEKGFLPLQPTLNDIATYLIHLFEDVGLQPSTIGVHKAAIASVLRHTQLEFDISSELVLTNLMKRFSLLRPRTVRISPRWDLALVMRQLMQPPFADADSISDARVSNAWFTRKTAFLLALASGARASEIHALSRSDHLFGVQPTPQGEVLVLRPFPGFLDKNALPQDTPKAWRIPSLSHLFPHDREKLLCPVSRAGVKYD